MQPRAINVVLCHLLNINAVSGCSVGEKNKHALRKINVIDGALNRKFIALAFVIVVARLVHTHANRAIVGDAAAVTRGEERCSLGDGVECYAGERKFGRICDFIAVSEDAVKQNVCTFGSTQTLAVCR